MVSCKLVLVILLAVAPYSVMSQAAAGAVCDATITCAATLACNEKPPADTPTGTFVCSKACTVNTDCVAPATCTPGTLAPVKSTCNLSALPTNGCKVACVSPLVCNTANLQCEAATTTTTTTVATTTTTVACSDIAPNCAALKAQGLCTDAKYLALMSSDCASTCGTCGSVGSVTTTTSATSCVDTLSSTTTTCTAMASLCNSGAYKEFMLSNCASTCKFCALAGAGVGGGAGGGIGVPQIITPTCVDLITTCSSLSIYCSTSAWYSYLTTNCARTCGRCLTSIISATTCADTYKANGTTDCTQAKKHLCTNATYQAIYRVSCPRLCGYCI